MGMRNKCNYHFFEILFEEKDNVKKLLNFTD